MFQRMQEPFLTVETGEAYQPIRIKYELLQKNKLVEILNSLKCCEKAKQANTWNWYWREECNELHFQSLESFKKSDDQPIRIATLMIKNGSFFISLSSFKRACLALPFFHRLIPQDVAKPIHADFINKVFGLDEDLPRGLNDIFDEEKLQQVVEERIDDYKATQKKCERAKTAEEAFRILEEYSLQESKKRLPFAERHVFLESTSDDPDVIYLGFYIYLRSRELVAIRRWFGSTTYTIADAAEETVEKVFGGMNIDIIE